ncbi:MAG: tRNA (5-methylaminomethyl-2-thiouridine)(34)-methyltransferase MnmD [Flavobacteriales bacterium]
MAEDKLAPRIIESGDGSHTLRVDALNENYHSHKGAIRESMHVFIRMGLEAIQKSNIRILEVGFGTGLNALLSALNAGEKHVHYTSLETYPLDASITEKLNYVHQIDDERAPIIFEALHQAPWNESTQITDQFQLEKRHTSLQAFEPKAKFDLIYYDAFAPHAQPELWEPVIWEKLYAMMSAGAVLVTYCAKGQVRRDMQSAGFWVERLEGPPGKREMMRAMKPMTQHE